MASDVKPRNLAILSKKYAGLMHFQKNCRKVWRGAGGARAARDCRKITTPRSKINGSKGRYFLKLGPYFLCQMPCV